MNVSSAIPLGAIFFFVILKTLIQVIGLPYIAWAPVARLSLLGKDIIPWLFFEGRSNGVDPILVVFS